MLEKLKSAEQKYIDIETRLASPDIFSDNETYTKLMKEYKGLTPIIEKFREYKKTEQDYQDAKEMLEEALDAEMREMVSDEYKSCQRKVEMLLEEFRSAKIGRISLEVPTEV